MKNNFRSEENWNAQLPDFSTISAAQINKDTCSTPGDIHTDPSTSKTNDDSDHSNHFMHSVNDDSSHLVDASSIDIEILVTNHSSRLLHINPMEKRHSAEETSFTKESLQSDRADSLIDSVAIPDQKENSQKENRREEKKREEEMREKAEKNFSQETLDPVKIGRIDGNSEHPEYIVLELLDRFLVEQIQKVAYLEGVSNLIQDLADYVGTLKKPRGAGLSYKDRILAALFQEPDYGYNLYKRLVDKAQHGLEIPQSEVYPVLSQMESEGLVSAQVSEKQNRMVKKYFLTEEGEKRFLENYIYHLYIWVMQMIYIQPKIKSLLADKKERNLPYMAELLNAGIADLLNAGIADLLNSGF